MPVNGTKFVHDKDCMILPQTCMISFEWSLKIIHDLTKAKIVHTCKYMYKLPTVV